MRRTLILSILALVVLGGLFFALRPDQTGSGPEARTIDVVIRGDSMTPAEISVGEGDTVTLRITADEETEVHVHGYDLEQEVAPNEPATVEFEAELTGRFEIEDESTHENLGVLVVQPR